MGKSVILPRRENSILSYFISYYLYEYVTYVLPHFVSLHPKVINNSSMKQQFQEAIKDVGKLFPDSEAVFQKAVKVMLLKGDRCLCDVPAGIYYIRIPGQYKLKCRCCRVVLSPLAVTPFNRQHRQLIETINLVGMFYQNKKALSVAEIATFFNCRHETAKYKRQKVIGWMESSINGVKLRKRTGKKDSYENRVCKVFSSQNRNIDTAIGSLFNTLPPLNTAIKATKTLINNK